MRTMKERTMPLPQRLPVPVWIVVLLAGAATPAGAGLQTEVVERALEVEAGAQVSVMNFAGQIAVRSAPPGERLLRFVAIKRLKPGVPAEEAERHFRRVNLDLHQTDGHVHIGPQPPHDADGRPREIPLTEVRAPRRIPPVLVDLEVWLPEDVSLSVRSFTAAISMSEVVAPGGRFLLRSISGPLSVNGLVAEDVVAKTVSGAMDLSNLVAHRCDIETLTADIQLDGRLQDDGWYEIRSHSGAVEIDVNPRSGFLLDASTFRGAIRSDFDLGSPPGPRSLAGRHGEGGPEINISTFSGPIRLLAPPDSR